jgi:sugar lactone lactonase YvrE
MKNRTCSAVAVTTIILTVTAVQSRAQSTYEPYTFSTLAGGGGFVSPEQPGTAVRLNTPAGVAVDSAGNIYVADTFNNAIRKVTPQGAVTTLAGLPGTFGSADGTGSEARFNYPDKLDVDSGGNVYVADSGNNTLRKVTPDGVVTTLAGKAGTSGSVNGTGSAARFNSPEGLAVDRLGNIYVADLVNFTIRKVAPEGTNWVVTTVAGRPGQLGSADGTGGAARFNWPQGLAIDRAGNLYVGDTDNYTVRKIAPVGTNWLVTTLVGRAGSRGIVDGTNGAARLSDPKGLAVDGAGNIYVADEENHLIRKITPYGTNWVVTTLAGKGLDPGSADGLGTEARFVFPYGVAADSAGNVYVADIGNSAIRKVTPVGTNAVVTTPAGFGSNYGGADELGIAARFKGPSAVAVDSAGNVYVADQGNHTLRKVTSNGAVTTMAGLAGYGGSADGTGDIARFNAPGGLAVDSAGNVYVAERGNNTIRKVAPSGTNWVVTTLAGSSDPETSQGSADGLGNSARFATPSGVAVDSAGDVYVADSLNHTIRQITPSGTVTTRAGTAEQSGSADGVGLAARFNNPNGLAIDSVNNLYVADTWNHTIRKITSTRVVSTLAGLAGNPGSADGIGKAARFNHPASVAVDSTGNLYVADTYNNTIRKLTPAGTSWVVTTLGGLAGFYGGADGTGSNARFSNPSGVAVDSAGNLYVADFYFNTIRKGVPMPTIVSSGAAFGFNAGHFGFGLTGPAGQPVVVEVSSDLTSWHLIWTNTFGVDLKFSDPLRSAALIRFYRARIP